LLQRGHRAAFPFVSGVDVDCGSLNARVTKDVLDRECVSSGFGESCPGRVTQDVESKILDPGVFKGGVKRLPRFQNLVPKLLTALEDALSLSALVEFQKVSLTV